MDVKPIQPLYLDNKYNKIVAEGIEFLVRGWGGGFEGFGRTSA